MDDTKSFDELCDVISTARQSVSIEFNSKEYITKEKICKVLKFMNADTVVLTKHNMLIPKKEKVSSVIICNDIDDDNDCMFISHKFKFVIFYSPNNNDPSLLIHRLLSIYYSQYQLISLIDETKAKSLNSWISCILFTTTTSIHKDSHSTEIIDILSKQYSDNEFVLDLQDVCNIVSSDQSMMCRMDLCRPRVSYMTTAQHSQNMNKILEILLDIVNCCCVMLNTDEKKRNETLDNKLSNNSAFEKVNKQTKISKTIVYETIIKLWNKLNYELTLNINNTELIRKTFQNIIHCWTIHYKHLIFVFITLVESTYENNDIQQQSSTILSLTEDYDKKIQNITKLTDSMCELICEVFKMK
jgi:ABC-type antimicrobial peptide transport system permease subunit